MFIKILLRIKKYLGNYSAASKYYSDSNNAFGKKKDETSGAVLKEFVILKSKMYLLLVDDNSEHKKAKSMNKNGNKRITDSKYKYVLFDKRYPRHSINRTESKNHWSGNYDIHKSSLSCFDDKINILNNRHDGLVLT